MNVDISLESDIPNEIIRNLNVIYSTPKGSVAFDRNFGIDLSILDLPINIAKAKLVAEYIKITKKYENRVKVKEVLFTYLDGNLIPKVVIIWN